MTPEEMRECRCLLDYLSDEDLVSLKDTVVGRKLVLENRREMIEVIIRCSSSAEELLQRRKIRREILFHYLASKSIIVGFTSEKSDLIKKVLALWSSLQPVNSSLKPSVSNTCMSTSASQTSTSATATASNTCLPAPTSQRSTSATTTASNTYLPAPTSQRYTSATASNTCLPAPTSQRYTSATTTASNTYLPAPTSQRYTSATTTASNTYLPASNSQRSTSATTTASNTYLPAPTSQRYTSATASNTCLPAPTSQRYTSATTTASNTYLPASNSQRSTSATTTASNTYLPAPTSQRYTSATASNTCLPAPTSQGSTSTTTYNTYLPAPTSQRSTSATTTASNTYLPAPTSQRSTSRTTTATASNQPLQQTPERSSFYKDTKTTSSLKRSASVTATVSNQPLQETSPKRSCYEYQQNQRILKFSESNTTCLVTSDSQRPASKTASVHNQRLQETSIRNFNEDQKILVVSDCQKNLKKKFLGDFHKKTENEVMGESFVIWFYKLLNAETSTMHPVDEVDKFGPQHFLDNCTLRIVSRTESFSDKTFTGSMLVSLRLKALVREEHLLFNPNVSKEGVHTVQSPFGFFMVMVCGTIHQHNSCLGTFKQAFGLVRESFQSNNWKIQLTHLHVESFHVTDFPKLSNSTEQDLLAIASAHAICLS